MPIHLDSIFSTAAAGESQLMTKLLSNPLYTAAVITLVFVLTVFLFFPLKSGSCSQYFKLLIYAGIICAIILSLHSDIIIKNNEKRFKQDALFTERMENSVAIEPRKGGFVEPQSPPTPEIDDEIEEIIKNLDSSKN